jgi:ABC-type glycerol-3-phosphate transport system permease component
MKKSTKISLKRMVALAILIFISMVILGPILWGFSTSLKAPKKILEYPPQFIPDEPTLMHYMTIFKSGIMHYFLNSTLITVSTVIICISVGSLAGFALSRFRYRGNTATLMLIVLIMSIPLVSLMVPTYTFLAKTGLMNTRAVLILLYAAYQLPMSVWILKSFFDTLPVELEEAAMIDGLTQTQALFRIVMPLSLPGMIAAGLFVLVFSWNDFVIALIMTSSDAVRTLPVGIYNYLGFFGREWGPLMASAMVSIVPIILLFIIFQRYFLSGMSRGAVKG